MSDTYYVFVEWLTHHNHRHHQRLCDRGTHHLDGRTQGKGTEQPGGVSKGFLWKSDQIARRYCSKMDLEKDQSHLMIHQTPDPHQEEKHVPEVIGTWHLRNREQLRKRKAEAQEKQTSQWQFGEKKHKRQRTGKRSERGRKRQQNTEMKVEPPSQLEKEVTEKAPIEKEAEPPGSETEALLLGALPQRVVPEKHFSEIGQESIIHQENSSEFQETAVQTHPSEIHQDMAESEDLSPKMCQEIAVFQDHPSKMCRDVAEPEDLSPKMCQEAAAALSSKTSEDMAVLEGCSPEAYPKPDVPEGYTLEMYQKRAEPEEHKSEPGQGIAETGGFIPKIQQEIAVPKELSTKTYQETAEPEDSSHKTYKEIAMPKAPSHETIQETPGSEEYSPETYQETPGSEDPVPDIYQETPGPEDLSTKTCKDKDVPKECFPEPYEETGGPQDEDPKAHQEEAKDASTFPQEMKEKPKAEEPEIPVFPNVPQEIQPENDIYSYVLF
ncbi:hemogen isoform X1 [Camelus dromedarius]|uniref:hemogen isoform X1 n=1 Tax=Camelus dromedarius TaxID=9838 RepID=UPI00057BA9BA|nr:hemogen isoform X1 [Camelus dromedarius]